MQAEQVAQLITENWYKLEFVVTWLKCCMAYAMIATCWNLHRPAHAVESLKELSDLQEAYSSPDFNVLIVIRCLLAKERVYGSRWPCSCTRPLMELRRHTWVNWFVSPIYLVDVPSALLGPIVCWCRPWNCLPSAAGPSRSPDPPSGTAYRTTWYLRCLCQPPVSIWKHFCSRPRCLALSLIPGKLFPTSSGPWSDFITQTTLKIHDWYGESLH